MRAVGRSAAVAMLAAGLLVFSGGAANAAGVRTELGCLDGGFLAFWDAAPCPGADEGTPSETESSEPESSETESSETESSETESSETESSEPESSETPSTDGGLAPATPDAPTAPAEPGPVPDAPADPAGMVFTPNPAILTAGTLSIEGLRSLEIVTVDLADGSTSRALKITADHVVIGGFGLDVPTGDGGLNTTASTLTVDGNVSIWTPSITAILADGVEHVIDTLSQPDPAALGELLQLRLPLLGMTADSVAYSDTDQAVYAG